MSKMFLLFTLLCAALTGVAQDKTATDAVTSVKQKQNNAAWACAACYKITKDGGLCADDKTIKIQLGTYYCQHCVKATGDKPGTCPTCKGATTQMTRKLCKEHTNKNVKKIA